MSAEPALQLPVEVMTPRRAGQAAELLAVALLEDVLLDDVLLDDDELEDELLDEPLVEEALDDDSALAGSLAVLEPPRLSVR